MKGPKDVPRNRVTLCIGDMCRPEAQSRAGADADDDDDDEEIWQLDTRLLWWAVYKAEQKSGEFPREENEFEFLGPKKIYERLEKARVQSGYKTPITIR